MASPTTSSPRPPSTPAPTSAQASYEDEVDSDEVHELPVLFTEPGAESALGCFLVDHVHPPEAQPTGPAPSEAPGPVPADWQPPLLRAGGTWVGGSLRREDIYDDDGR